MVTDALAPIRERTEKLLANESELDALLAGCAAAGQPDRPAHHGGRPGPDRLPAGGLTAGTLPPPT